MAAVEVTITGMLYDKLARTSQNVVLIGEASLTGLGIGGGPIIPPGQPPGGGGPVDPGFGVPTPPDVIWGGRPPPGYVTPPIYYPPLVPPSLQPPEPPAPGSPTTPVPGIWPVAPIVPPPYLIVQYPGIGPVTVAPPVAASPTETP